MSFTTFILGQAAVGAFTLTWLLVVFCFFAREDQPGTRALAQYCNGLERHLRFLRLRYSGTRILWGQLASVVGAIVLALVEGACLPLIIVPIAVLAPKLQIERLVARRVTAIDALIESWLNAIANALKASPSLGEAIAASASLLP
ncbi:MAG TPA: hypothetical protein VIV60_28310, partial [Polyangiaceae bacterium]